MSSSIEKMKELLKEENTSEMERVSVSAGHSQICNCSSCMENKLSEDETQKHMHELHSTMVDRRNPDNPQKPLMKSAEAHAILKTGSMINMMDAVGLNKSDLPSGYDIQLTEPKELTINAVWKHRNQETAKSGRNANVFGGLGVLAISPEVKIVDIPKMNALAVPQSFLQKYGAELIPLDQTFQLDDVEHEELKTLFLVEYKWDKEYIQNFVMNPNGGGGLFVETHPFPHVFTPLSPDCSGALILGVKREDGQFDFACFEIPFGFTMKIGSNVIHGDSFFVGPYAIALTETELADSVLLKQGTPEREIQTVQQNGVEPAKLPLQAGSEWMNKASKQMMVDQISQGAASDKPIAFFRKLPADVLTKVHHVSENAQEAFDQQFGLVTTEMK